MINFCVEISKSSNGWTNEEIIVNKKWRRKIAKKIKNFEIIF
jgi:hypothetical protein